MTDPAHNQPSCAKRAGWAQSAVMTYARTKEGCAYDPVADLASDLMTDLCHLLVQEGVLPDLILERARSHCQEACLEEGIVI